MKQGLWVLGTDVVRIIAEYWAETEEECSALEAVGPAHTARVIDGFPWTKSKFLEWVRASSYDDDAFDRHRVGLRRLVTVSIGDLYELDIRRARLIGTVLVADFRYAEPNRWEYKLYRHVGTKQLLDAMSTLAKQ